MGESPSDRLGGDHSAGPRQRTGEGGPHIQMTPSEERFNQNAGLEVPGCWIAMMRREGGPIFTDLRPPIMTCIFSSAWL